jgi:signal transduction histidine kinase
MKTPRTRALLPGNGGLHLGLTLLLALTVGLPALQMREALRSQFLTLQSSNMNEVLRMELATEHDRLAELGQAWSDMDTFAVVLRSSRMTGVVGVRYWPSSSTEALCLPASLDAGLLPAALHDRLGRSGPHALIHPSGEDLPEGLSADTQPDLLEINLPLPDNRDAAVQYWVAGSQAAATLRAIDRNVGLVALMVWLGTAGLANLLVHLGLRRILGLNKDLDRRSQDLARANEELKLAAKSSALGTVTAHLLHGLKNPVDGLRGLAHERGGSPQDEEGAWHEAARLADRLQAMVEEVALLLKDDSGGLCYEIEWSELREQVERRVDHTGRTTGVGLSWKTTGTPRPLDNRIAGLLALALGNLIENALQASARGQVVDVITQEQDEVLNIEIQDKAGGLPEQVSRKLFLPVASSRAGGTGIGLAISRQLILQAGGEIRVRTDASGTSFFIRLPAGPRKPTSPSPL